ncbi:MAG: uncharacterized SAM-binding protein YcdF (DUF218 family) [Myxococcota bacterium]|jgi:uncharacterized SAM-binding protein YcdF (DUF218 family)
MKKIPLIAVALWLLAALLLDLTGRRDVSGQTFDAIIVAGCRVMPDGTPSDPLKDRVALAAELWHAGAAPTLILTGGVGAFPPAEAVAAADLAAQLGVPRAVMIIESASTSTEENARLAALHTSAASVLVISDAYHVFRIRRVFARHFDAAEATGSTTHPWQRLRGSLREVAAVGWYAIRGRL